MKLGNHLQLLDYILREYEMRFKFLKAALVSSAFIVSSFANAGIILSEGFDDINALTGAGWSLQNLSSPIGVTNFFQGNPGVFSAQSGTETSYIAANFNNTGGIGTISNWLITPEMSLSQALTLTFYTRTDISSVFPDRLEVRLSKSGASSNVGATADSIGDFTSLLLSVNPFLSGDYPQEWTAFTVKIDAQAGSGRLALRYFVTDGGPAGNNSNFIGIDTLSVAAAKVPEPSTMAVLALGLIGLGARRFKKQP